MPYFSEVIVKVIDDLELRIIQDSLRYMGMHQVNDWEIAESYHYGNREQVLIASQAYTFGLHKNYLYIKLSGVESLLEASEISKKLIDILFVKNKELKAIEITPTLITYILL